MNKLQDMPIMDRLYVGSQIMVPMGDLGDPSIPSGNFPQTVDKPMFQWLSTFKRVRMNDNDRMNLPSGTKTWDVSKAFGHLMLPFPRLWIEWNNVRNDDTGTFPTLWMAAICETWKHAKENGTQGVLEIAIRDGIVNDSMRDNSWIITPLAMVSGAVSAIPMILIVDLDEHGVLEGVRGINGAAIHLRSIGQRDVRSGDELLDTAEVVDLVWDALVAVGWMNCRNVQIRHHDRSRNIAGSKRNRFRNQARSLDFHTIHLPGVEYESDGSVSQVQRDLRMHQVRGHFKTFTSDAPLLGMHTGTYWWGWQVRGSKKNGVVVSDYKIGASA